MPNKTLKAGNILPPDTFFYTIPLDPASQCLTRTMLNGHYPALGKKAFMGNHCDYISYAHGILTTQLFLNDNTQYRLSMHVGLAELHIACSCGMPDEKLCRHAYLGLYDMIWRHSLDFREYYWPGYESDEKIQRKFLQVDVHKQRITVEPKVRYGNIFRPDIGFTDNKHLSIKEQAVPATIFSGNREVMAYCLCYSFGTYYSVHLPVVIPCLGITGKNNKQVISFLQFSTRKKPVGNFAYTSNQRILNEISLKQHELAKTYDQSTGDEKRSTLPAVKEQLLGLWHEAIPLLAEEKFCYTYYLYWLKFLHDKPRKAVMRPCGFSADKPVLSFVLKSHGDHFSFTAEVRINGDLLEISRKPHFFVFDDKNSGCYLMQTVQDDDLLMWVLSNNKRLTILNPHFIEFHHAFLDQVSRCYDVVFINASGKKKKYVLDDVLKDASLQNPSLR
jgi:hypothetical protein